MQWNNASCAGFTSGTPWIEVNPNYREINATAEIADKESIFHYYMKLIKLRKRSDVIIYGSFEPLMEDDTRIFAYIRRFQDEKLLVLCNFTDEESPMLMPEEFCAKEAECVISNYSEPAGEYVNKLRPYEAAAYLKRG